MRTFLLGLVVMVTFTVLMLATRPGGFRQQLRLAGRRFRIALVLGGIYVLASAIIRLIFTTGFIADYGALVVAVMLIVAYLVVAQDPKPQTKSVQRSSRN